MDRIDILENNRLHLPIKAELVLDRMVEYKWLENYHDLDFLEQVSTVRFFQKRSKVQLFVLIEMKH